MEKQGWIKLHRKILENPISKNPIWSWLWVILLLKANHKENKFMWNSNLVIVKEGQFITSRDELSKASGIKPTSVERILKMLENGHQIEQQKTTKYRLITIVNWKDYQEKDSNVDNKRTTNGQQTDTNKNDNNIKNEKEEDRTETSSGDIPLLIKSFESINPASKKFYGNKTQRIACQSLLDLHGLERVQQVVEKTLPKTNGMQFFPTITTPLQLMDKWVSLESAVRKYQSEKQQNITKNKVAF